MREHSRMWEWTTSRGRRVFLLTRWTNMCGFISMVWTRDEFDPTPPPIQEPFGNIWRHFWLLRFKGCYQQWVREARATGMPRTVPLQKGAKYLSCQGWETLLCLEDILLPSFPRWVFFSWQASGKGNHVSGCIFYFPTISAIKYLVFWMISFIKWQNLHALFLSTFILRNVMASYKEMTTLLSLCFLQCL